MQLQAQSLDIAVLGVSQALIGSWESQCCECIIEVRCGILGRTGLSDKEKLVERYRCKARNAVLRRYCHTVFLDSLSR